MTGSEAIAYIHSMVWNRKATGYEHAKTMLEKMGNPEKKLKYICGVGADICEGIGADFRFGLMFRNGLYLMADLSLGNASAATLNIGYNFGKLFNVK